MTEQPHNGDIPELRNRLNELKSLTILLQKGLTEPSTPEVIQAQAARAGKIISDIAWIRALQLSGFSPEIILKIYNIKDLVTEGAKADSNPS
ncbi:MAG: hypothetical protein PHQ59_00465 [Candidatus Daviesbacteria bacterium]|nr:hypothetical protein [Candidatus Daviesbacteria bacterium]